MARCGFAGLVASSALSTSADVARSSLVESLEDASKVARQLDEAGHVGGIEHREGRRIDGKHIPNCSRRVGRSEGAAMGGPGRETVDQADRGQRPGIDVAVELDGLATPMTVEGCHW